MNLRAFATSFFAVLAIAASGHARAQTADLSAVKFPVGGSPVIAGTNLTWGISVENAGPSNGADVSLIDTFGDGSFVSLTSPPGWSCATPPIGAGPGGTVSCTVPDLPPGTASFLLTVHLDFATLPGLITNSAIISSTTPDPDDIDTHPMSAVAVVAPPVPTIGFGGLLALIALLATAAIRYVRHRADAR